MRTAAWSAACALSEIKKFKPMADFDWSWPAKIERDVIERALTLDFLPEARNLVLVGANGLGKTMIAQNICHAAVLAGHSVLFRSAAALLEELHRQTPKAASASCAPTPTWVYCASTRSGILSFDDKSADLLYEVINRRYERKSRDPHHQSTVQRVERSLSQRRLHRHPAGSPAASRRRHGDRGRQLPGARKRAGDGSPRGGRNDARRRAVAAGLQPGAVRLRGADALRRSAGHPLARECFGPMARPPLP